MGVGLLTAGYPNTPGVGLGDGLLPGLLRDLLV